MDIVLSSSVKQGLETASDTNIFSDKQYTILINNVFEMLNHSIQSEMVATKGLEEVDSANLKHVFSSVTTLVLEAAKHDSDKSTISSILEECHFDSDRTEHFNKNFVESKSNLRKMLARTGNHLPSIVDVNWRLDCSIKNNNSEKINKPEFLVKIITDSVKNPNLQFSCSHEELEDLVGKLKDASKSIERVANM